MGRTISVSLFGVRRHHRVEKKKKGDSLFSVFCFALFVRLFFPRDCQPRDRPLIVDLMTWEITYIY